MCWGGGKPALQVIVEYIRIKLDDCCFCQLFDNERQAKNRMEGVWLTGRSYTFVDELGSEISVGVGRLKVESG